MALNPSNNTNRLRAENTPGLDLVINEVPAENTKGTELVISGYPNYGPTITPSDDGFDINIISESYQNSCFHSVICGNGTEDKPLQAKGTVLLAQDHCNLLCCTEDGLEAKLEYITHVPTNNCFVLDVYGHGSELSPLNIVADLNISNNHSNAIKCQTDGLYVSETYLTASDTPCLSTTLDGDGTFDSNWNISSHIIFDDHVDNQAFCTAKGLFVKPTKLKAPATSYSVDVNIDGSGSTENPYCIVATAIISKDSCNLLQDTPEGLLVPDYSNIIGCETETAFIKVGCGTGKPDDPKQICAIVKISDNDILGPNTVFEEPDGLYVPPTFVDVCDSPTVSLEICGNGSHLDSYIIKSHVKIEELAGQLLSSGPNGLVLTCESIKPCFVDFINNGEGDQESFHYNTSTSQLELQLSTDHDNNLTIGTDGKPYVQPYCGDKTDPCLKTYVDLETNKITAELVVSEQPHNNLICTDNGLFSHEYLGSYAGDTDCIDVCVEDYNITAKLNISENQCNGAKCLPDGLYVDGNSYGEFQMQIPGCIAPCAYPEYTYPVFSDRVIDGYSWYLNEAPIGSDLSVNILVNGQVIGNLSIPSGTPNGSVGIQDLSPVLEVSAGDKISLSVISTGDAVPGSDLNFVFNYFQCKA